MSLHQGRFFTPYVPAGLQGRVRQAIWIGLLATLVTTALSSCGDGPPDTTSTQSNQTASSMSSATPESELTPTNAPTQVPTATSTPLSSLRGFVNGRWLEEEDPQLASSIKELNWIRDGIDSAETGVLQNLLYVAAVSRPVASSLVSLDWVQDGIDDLEAGAIDWISNVASAEVASAIVSLGWIQDGIGSLETQAIEVLSDFSHGHTVAALSVLGMPFMETIEPPDISAVTSLWLLASDQLGTFETVMSHNALRDGISDDLAPVVATLHGVARTNPGLIETLLDSNKVRLEQRTISLPLSGEVVLFIIRTSQGAARSMESLEHSVRSVEEYLGSALPTNYIGLLYANAVDGSSLGENSGTRITILPDYDVAEGTREAEYASFLIAHEVAHYYWSGNSVWVDEGAAEFMASIVAEVRTRHSIAAANPPLPVCSQHRGVGGPGDHK